MRALRIVCVSDTGLDRGQVYGLRVATVAAELARLGHRVVVLCPATGEASAIPDGAVFESHDWSAPLVLAAAADRAAGGAPHVLSKAVTALSFLVHGGTDRGWRRGSRRMADVIAAAFAPDLVWATFGTTTNLAVAQRLARRARAKWIADLKDNADLYVPASLRGALARRFRDAAALTSNARLHADAARRWLGRPATVLYSGIAPGLLSRSATVDRDEFRIALIGSVYDEGRLSGFLEGLRDWLATRSPQEREKIRFLYAGISSEMVAAATKRIGLDVGQRISAGLPHAELGEMCQSAAVNCYVWHPQTFHHKALELLACRRPIVSFPGEHDETLALAAEVGGSLAACGGSSELGAAFDRIFAGWLSGAAEKLDYREGSYSWRAAAQSLEAVMLACVGANA